MRRFVSVWLNHWPIDRLRRALTQASVRGDLPAKATGYALKAQAFALVSAGTHGLRLTAVNAQGWAAGARPGQALADARAACPGLVTRPAEPQSDARALAGLGDWAELYAPFTATDDQDGLLLDISGVAHLFGGEDALLQDLHAKLRALGYSARLGLASTIGAAWALARHGANPYQIAAPGDETKALSLLPVAALRLDEDTIAALGRLGLKRIGDITVIARPALARRFRGLTSAARVLERLDQALGRNREPLNPRRPTSEFRVRMAFADPIAATDDLAAALRRLAQGLCDDLAKAHQGARAVDLICCRSDGQAKRLTAGTARATRDPDHLVRLFAERLGEIDPGFGLDAMILAAAETERLDPRAVSLTADAQDPDALAALVDRIALRVGAGRIGVLQPCDTHQPDHAQSLSSGLPNPLSIKVPHSPPRPLRLLARPEPAEVMSEVPDGPPRQFRFRRTLHQVVRAEGPERIAPDWSQLIGQSYEDGQGPQTRDYFRVEDQAGRRFWLYRAGLYGQSQTPRWYIHGVFA